MEIFGDKGIIVSIVESIFNGLSIKLVNLLVIALIKSFKKYHKIIISLSPISFLAHFLYTLWLANAFIQYGKLFSLKRIKGV